jgi:hypothetical protein
VVVTGQESWEVSYEVTPAAKRKAWLRIARNAVLTVVPVATLLLVIVGRLSTVTLPLLLGAAVGIVINGVRRGPRGLELASEGITYRDGSFTLAASWANVDSLVRLAPRPSALAIRLASSAVVVENRFPIGAPWRQQPFPFDRTIPLEPFIDGDPDQAVTARLREVMPSLFGMDPQLVPREPVRVRWRAIGLGASLVPVTLAGAIALALLGPRPLDAQTLRVIGAVAIVLVGVLMVGLWRWHAASGERTMDYIGRGLVAPRAGESRLGVVRALAPTYGVLVLSVAIGLGVGRLAAAPTGGGPAARYGQAHTCYFNANHKISGCVFNDGTTRGTATNAVVTCYFDEPVPAGTLTYHCDR